MRRQKDVDFDDEAAEEVDEEEKGPACATNEHERHERDERDERDERHGRVRTGDSLSESCDVGGLTTLPTKAARVENMGKKAFYLPDGESAPGQDSSS